MKLLFDLHTHTVASGHAFSTLKENIEEYNYVIKLDIEKYYDSINHEILEDKLINIGINEDFIELLKRAISRPIINEYELYNSRIKKSNNQEGVPQGLSISNILAAIYKRDR